MSFTRTPESRRSAATPTASVTGEAIHVGRFTGYAEFWKRLAAFVMDYLIVVAATSLIGRLILRFGGLA